MVATESKLRHKRGVGVSGERKSSTWRRRGYTKVLRAEKHDISEERKEFQLGQSMARMLRDRAQEGTMHRAL